MRLPELSMRDLFPHCIRVMQDALLPLHYREITRRALALMEIRQDQIAFDKEIENVREKLLAAGRYGAFYTGAPLCMGGLKAWFQVEDLLLHADEIRIPGNATAGVEGAFEGLMRSPFMNNYTRNTEAIYRARAGGLVLEKHVTDWFQRTWPSLFLPPDNDGKWAQWCTHDFKLAINGRTLLVDVAGPNRHGQYGRKHMKQCTHAHLLCEIRGADCFFRAVVSGDRYIDMVFPDSEASPFPFVVWLNCHRDGVDYRSVRDAAMGRRTAA